MAMGNQLETLKSKFHRIRDWWKDKTPAQKWDTIMKIGIVPGHLIGVHLFCDLINTWYSASCGLMIAMFFVLNSYTIQYYLRRGAVVRGMECTYLLGVVVGNMFVYWEAVGPHRFKFNAIAKFCGNYFYSHENKTLRHENLRKKHIKKLLGIVIVILGAMLLAYGIVFLVPMYESYHRHDRKITPLAINLPFFEKDSPDEFVVNMFLQLTMASYSLCGNFLIELASSTINNAIILVPDLIRFNLMEFQEELEINGITPRSKAQLRNVFCQLQDYHRYLRDVIAVYANKLFICPFVWAFSMSLSIFAALALGKIGGLGSAIACYVEMMVVCYMGNNVKETNEKIPMEFYNMPWYAMPVSMQKQLVCAMHHAQNGAVLTMGPLGDLDFEMASDFTRSIYKFTMLLNTMFK